MRPGQVTGGNGVGGLVGVQSGGSISQSFATGAVQGNANVGGLVGQLGSTSAATSVTNAYAWGTVYVVGTTGLNAPGGGLIGTMLSGSGANTTTITNSYAVGAVTTNGVPNSPILGGFVGWVESGSGNSAAASYWNTSVNSSLSGVGCQGASCTSNITLSGTLTGETTATLQGTAIGSGIYSQWTTCGCWTIQQGTTYPFFSWYAPPGTETISGTVYTTYGGAAVGSGVSVFDVIGGVQGSSSVTTNSNGQYTFSISTALVGSQLLVYVGSGTSGGVSFQESATGQISGLSIYEGYSTQNTAAPSILLSTVTTDFATGKGGLTLPTPGNQVLNIAALAFSINQAINLSGNLVLNSTGTVTQSQPITAIGGLNLLGSGGTYTLTNTSNSIGALAANTGAISVTDKSALAIGTVAGTTGVTATGNVTLTTNSIAVSEPITATGETVTIQPLGSTTTTGLGTGSGTLSLSQTSLNNITAATLIFGSTGSSGAMNVGGAVTVPATSTNLSLLSGGAIDIDSGASLANGNSNGSITLQGGSLSIGGSVTINTGTTATLVLDTTGTATQSAAITATDLVLLGSGGSYTLTSSSNSVGTLAANTGSVNFTDSSSLTVNTVAGTNNLSATGAVTLTTDALTLTASTGLIKATGQTVTIQPLTDTNALGLGTAAAGLSLTQTTLNDITAATLVFGSTNSTGGITVGSSISAPSTITNLSLVSGGTIAVNAALADSNANGTLSLQGSGLTLGADVTASSTSGNVVMNTPGTASQSAGTITAANLVLLGTAGSYTLIDSNDIGTLAASVGTGSVNLNNGNNALSIGTAGGINGVTAGTLTLTDTGTVTQSNSIGATNLVLLGSGGSYALNSSSNSIGTLAASTGTLSVTDNTALTIGTVGTTTGITATTGNVTLSTNAITVSEPINASGQTVTIQPLGSGVTLGLGSGAGTLVLSDAGLGQITAALVNFGNSTSGTLTEAGSLTIPASVGALELTTGGAINISGAISGSGLIINAGGAITDTSSVNLASFTLDAGNWSQNYSTLNGSNGANSLANAFSATNFVLNGGTFLRTVGTGEDGQTVPYQIFDVYGLQGVGTELTSNFTLAQNIDATGTATWNNSAGFAPIGGTYTGTFNGQGYAINGLTINNTTAGYVGLFAQSSGTIENLALTNVNILGPSGANVGALVGYNTANITNVSVTGSVTGGDDSFGQGVGGLVGYNAGTIMNSYSVATVSGAGYSNVGGLVGYNDGSITQSHATGAVSGIATTDYGPPSVGGLVGLNDSGGAITYSYATGTISIGASAALSSTNYAEAGGLVGLNVGTIGNSYATGSVLVGSEDATAGFGSGAAVGGLVGVNDSGAITQSYATGAVTGSGSGADVGGLVGYNGNLFYGVAAARSRKAMRPRHGQRQRRRLCGRPRRLQRQQQHDHSGLCHRRSQRPRQGLISGRPRRLQRQYNHADLRGGHHQRHRRRRGGRPRRPERYQWRRHVRLLGYDQQSRPECHNRWRGDRQRLEYCRRRGRLGDEVAGHICRLRFHHSGVGHHRRRHLSLFHLAISHHAPSHLRHGLQRLRRDHTCRGHRHRADERQRRADHSDQPHRRLLFPAPRRHDLE